MLSLFLIPALGMLPPTLVDNTSKRLEIPFPQGQGTGGRAAGNALSYFCGGRNETSLLAFCDVFDPATCLTSEDPASLCRLSHTIALPGRWAFGSARAFQKLWLVGGFTNIAGTQVTNLIESATLKGVVRSEGTLSVARAYSLVLSSGNRILVIGGIDQNVQYPNIDVYRDQNWYRGPSTLKHPRGESCGGFIESSDGESIIVAGGRNKAGVINREVEIINNADIVADNGFFLKEGRFGCAAVTAPDRRSVFVIGGIGGSPASRVLASVERITAAGSQNVLQMPGGGRSHMSIVEAPVSGSLIYAFIIGGNTKYVAQANMAETFPPFKHKPSGAVDVLVTVGDGRFVNLAGLTLTVPRSYPSAVLSLASDGITSYVIVGGGYTKEDKFESKGKIELIKFETGTRAPTPAPTSQPSSVSTSQTSQSSPTLETTTPLMSGSSAISSTSGSTSIGTPASGDALDSTQSPFSSLPVIIGFAVAALLIIGLIIALVISQKKKNLPPGSPHPSQQQESQRQPRISEYSSVNIAPPNEYQVGQIDSFAGDYELLSLAPDKTTGTNYDSFHDVH